jgi:hypothetical protein
MFFSVCADITLFPLISVLAFCGKKKFYLAFHPNDSFSTKDFPLSKRDYRSVFTKHKYCVVQQNGLYFDKIISLYFLRPTITTIDIGAKRKRHFLHLHKNH